MKMWQLEQRKNLDLNIKIKKTQVAIRNWYKEWGGKVYISFSGGKDSTVLVDIARNIYPNIPIVFCQMGLQFPEVKKFARSYITNENNKEITNKYGYKQEYYKDDNFTIIYPKIKFREVIKKYGYPVVSKEQAEYIYQYRNHTSEKTKKLRWEGDENGSYKISEKWKYLVNAPFKISHKCCDIMKKRPFKRYEKETGNKPILAIMTEDSRNRLNSYLRNGCNAFKLKRPRSQPMAFWTEQDILQYIKENNLKIADVYGDIVEEDNKLKTTDRQRTGCIFCMFGVHMEDEPNRFQRMKKTHPKLWNYCINNLELKDILDYINVPYK